MIIKDVVKDALRNFGLQLAVYEDPEKISPDMDPDFQKIYTFCKPYTLLNKERLYSLYKATEYIIKNDIPGDIVECGVWRGGSIMVSALTMKNLKNTNRKLYMYDTYEGMSKPTKKDVLVGNQNIKAMDKWVDRSTGEYANWRKARIDEVKENLYSTGYPKNNLIFVKGKVENTIPKTIPSKISILRLDTDWFESTYHELKYLFPKISKNGVLIIDDYGYWKGSRDATDKYIKENKVSLLLARTDYTERIAIKT
jgi:hypothetical protein